MKYVYGDIRSGYLLSLKEINGLPNYTVKNGNWNNTTQIWNTAANLRITIPRIHIDKFGDGKIYDFKFKEQKGKRNTLRELWYVLEVNGYSTFEVYGVCISKYNNAELFLGKELFEL